MPTESKRAIRTTTAWNADQVAMEALYGAGNYYTTLSAWEAGEQRNLVTADEIAVAVCYNDWPSGLNDNVTVDGWTTDATRYVKITVAEGHRHNGTPGTGFWMYKTGDYIRTVSSQTGFTQLEWLDLRNAAAGTDANALSLQGTTVATNMLLTCGSSRAVLSLRGGKLRSSLIYNGANGVLAAASAAGTTENCVFANMTGYGVGAATSDAGPTIKNCVFWNTTMPSGAGNYTAASTNNASSSASGLPGANAVYNVTSAAFVDAANNDFHLSSGSVLRGAGVNLYSDFTTDIDGDTWPSSGAWDIGFDYYVEAGGALTIDSITASLVTSSGARITLGVTR